MKAFAYIYIASICLLMLPAACTRTVYLPEVHTKYRDRVKYDSVVQRDSIVVLKEGDTVFIYKDRWRDRVHTERDTVAIYDSIPYPVTVEKPVKYVPAMYRWSFGFSLLVVGLMVGWLLWRLKR